MTKEILHRILNRHSKWLNNEPGGERARLCEMELREVNLSNVNLSRAILSEANLCGADLSGANLSGADFYGANLRGASFWGANLSEANFNKANLTDADLSEADLNESRFQEAILSGTNLYGVQNIDKSIWNLQTAFYPLQCPSEGEYTAFGIVCEKIVKLLIPSDAKRCSATERMCRANKAIVLDIMNLDGTPFENNKNFIYKIGEIIEVPDFNEYRWSQLSSGIYHFITKEEALKYSEREKQ